MTDGELWQLYHLCFPYGSQVGTLVCHRCGVLVDTTQDFMPPSFTRTPAMTHACFHAMIEEAIL